MKFYKFNKCNISCDTFKQELALQLGVVSMTENFFTVELYAPRFPFESWLLLLNLDSHCERMPKLMYNKTASILEDAMSSINRALGYPRFNFISYSSPIQGEGFVSL